MTMLITIVIFGISALLTRADFIYTDFNETTGLHFIGDAGTTNCFVNSVNAYGEKQGLADTFNQEAVKERGENTDLIKESTVETNLALYNAEIEKGQAGFLHRSDTITAPSRCSVRARLTPSGPSKTGGLWFLNKVPVLNGFDTQFTFQISDHSKECVLVKDQYFSKIHHRTCSVHGGDGFAFVIHSDPNKLEALGDNGSQMGFGGIENSLAIAFDTWTNPGEDTMFADHVSIQSKGTRPNSAVEDGLLGIPRFHDLADGEIHRARIVYYGDLRPQYFDKLIASDSLLPYLKDNGEQKRVGTLLVFLDNGIANDIPLMALPINLSLLLELPDDKAFVGFTSSTGRFYEKHDILSWTWCDQEPCDETIKDKFDYHQQSKYFSSSIREFAPGAGYGGGDASDKFPTKNRSPDTTSFELPLQHFSTDRNIGLAEDAASQIPPYTLY